jgi:UrcA family protein
MVPPSIRRLAPLLASGLLFATPALAADPDGAARMTVRTNDLDLSTEAGAQALRHRVKIAASVACEAKGRDLQSVTRSEACRNDMIAQADQQVQFALARAQGGKALAANEAHRPHPGF